MFEKIYKSRRLTFCLRSMALKVSRVSENVYEKMGEHVGFSRTSFFSSCWNLFENSVMVLTFLIEH